MVVSFLPSIQPSTGISFQTSFRFPIEELWFPALSVPANLQTSLRGGSQGRWPAQGPSSVIECICPRVKGHAPACPCSCSSQMPSLCLLEPPVLVTPLLLTPNHPDSPQPGPAASTLLRTEQLVPPRSMTPSPSPPASLANFPVFLTGWDTRLSPPWTPPPRCIYHFPNRAIYTLYL